jgi:hypothetical protein
MDRKDVRLFSIGWYVSKPLLSRPQVIRLRMEKTASVSSEYFVHEISSSEQPTRSGPPAWKLGEDKKLVSVKNQHITKWYTRPRICSSSCEYVNELRVSISGGEFINHLVLS